MKNSRLVNILRSFSKKEVRELRKWLSSPAHNQREDVFLLFEYLFKNKHLETEKHLEKSYVYQRIFSKETFDDAKMRQVIYFLLKAVEDFLVYKELLGNHVQTKITLAKVYRKRKLNKSFQKTIKNIESLQETYPFRNENYYRNEYILQQEQYAYENQFKRVTSNLQAVSDALDISFIADKLRQSCLMITHQSIYKANYNFNLINEVVDLIEETNFLKIPAIELYFYTYKILTNPKDETAFIHLKERIVKLGHFFPHSEIRDIYLLAINYCIKKTNAGNKEFIRESFDLYREGLKREILIENNILSRWTFLNIVTFGTHLKEFDWTKDFIEKYQLYLENQHRETFVLFCSARLYFEQKNYTKAMRLLIQIDYDGMLMNLAAKTILLKIYYEEEEFDALESLLESMRTYIQRKKVMGYHKANYKNIISYTKKLLRINPYDKSAVEKLKVEIKGIKPLTEKPWLLEQLEKV